MQIAWSEDQGRSFGAARRVDGGGALGRVDACANTEGRVLVSWLQKREGVGAWMGSPCVADAPPGATFSITHSSAERAAGMLRLAADGDGWLAVWTEDDGSGLRGARVRAPAP